MFVHEDGDWWVMANGKQGFGTILCAFNERGTNLFLLMSTTRISLEASLDVYILWLNPNSLFENLFNSLFF